MAFVRSAVEAEEETGFGRHWTKREEGEDSCCPESARDPMGEEEEGSSCLMVVTVEVRMLDCAH